MVEEVFINKVSQSGIVTIDLETLVNTNDIAVIDIQTQLFQGLILREKDFREFCKNHDWQQYANKIVGIYCSTDAIIPTWAYMLIVSKLSGIAQKIVFGNLETTRVAAWHQAIEALPIADYTDKRIVIKGCSKNEVPVSAYVHISEKMIPVAQSLMFGEPCSTVPVYKKKS